MLQPLWAFTPVYRVVEVLWTTETGEGEPRIVTGAVQYRWTFAGAERLRKRLAAADHGRWVQGYVTQLGVVHWVPADEHDRVVAETPWNQDQNVDRATGRTEGES